MHIVSVGVQTFESVCNSQGVTAGLERPHAVRDYVYASLGGDFDHFRLAQNTTHWRIFTQSFCSHYPEFSNCYFRIIDARNVSSQDPAELKTCHGHCGFHPLVKEK